MGIETLADVKQDLEKANNDYEKSSTLDIPESSKATSLILAGLICMITTVVGGKDLGIIGIVFNGLGVGIGMGLFAWGLVKLIKQFEEKIQVLVHEIENLKDQS